MSKQEPNQQQQFVVKARGIFHPAFLAMMQKYIVIELFVARSIQKINQAFADGKIDFVTAGHVRGIEDVIVRRYVERTSLSESEEGIIPSLSQPYSLPYSRLDDVELAAAFDIDAQAPNLRVMIRPTEIKKFRGQRVNELGKKEWRELLDEIMIAAHGREAKEEIIALAVELPEDQSIPTKYRSVFLGVEQAWSVGRETQLRDTYVFIAVENENEIKRFRDFVYANLMDDERVRDIYQFAQMEANPVVRRAFKFLFRLRCTVFEADDILSDIQTWAGQTGVRVGTRSYDAWKTIKRAATRGILKSTMTPEVVALQRVLCAIDRDFAFETPDLEESWANAISDQQRIIRRIRSAEVWSDLDKEVTQFLSHACVYNCVSSASKKRRYRKAAATHWVELYKFPEASARLLLVHGLGLPAEAKRPVIVAKLKEVAPNYFKDQRTADGGYLKWFGDLYDDVIKERSSLSELARSANSLLSPFRNVAAHGGGEHDFEAMITVSGNGWHAELDALRGKVDAMCKLIVGFANELHAKGLQI